MHKKRVVNKRKKYMLLTLNIYVCLAAPFLDSKQHHIMEFQTGELVIALKIDIFNDDQFLTDKLFSLNSSLQFNTSH